MDSSKHWRALLEVAVQRSNKTAVAAQLQVSRSYVSRAMSTGRAALASVPQAFIARVKARYLVVECPFRQATVPWATCLDANQPAPTHNPLMVAAWRACQKCPKKPAGSAA